MRMYKKIPRNTTIIQGTPRNTTIFQGIQGDTKGTLNRTEWYANVKQNGMRMYKEIPRNTAKFQGKRRNTMRFQGIHGEPKDYVGIQRDSQEYKEIQKRNTK